MQTDGLVIRAIAKSLPIANKQFRVETPCHYRSRDYIVVAIRICSLGYIEELPAPTGISRPESSVSLL